MPLKNCYIHSNQLRFENFILSKFFDDVLQASQQILIRLIAFDAVFQETNTITFF